MRKTVRDSTSELNGVIVKSNAGLYDVYVQSEDHIVQVTSRGILRYQDKQPIVGDYVLLQNVDDTLIIGEILPRKNQLIRPLVANIDVCLTVISVKEPTFQQYLLDKYIALLTFHRIAPIIVFTKYDLLSEDEREAVQAIESYYEKIGYACFAVANKEISERDRLTKQLAHTIAAIMGQTGVGKTTLLNELSNHVWNLKTAKISRALGRGKHTTRIVELFRLDNYWLADTPGFSSFRLDDIKANELTHTFTEFADYPCQFNDCVHINEKRCGVKAAVTAGEIFANRYESYRKLYQEIKTQEDEKKW